MLGALASSKATGVERVLLERLGAEDLSVRAAAANALADLKVAAAVQPLADAYRRAAAESSYTARAAVLGALARLDPAAARPVLIEALKDRDWAVRVRALTLLREQKVTGQDEAARPATAGRVGHRSAVAGDRGPAVLAARVHRHRQGHDRNRARGARCSADRRPASSRWRGRDSSANVAIHRVVPDFVVQAGDPRGDGEGGPGFTIRDELNELPYLRGTVGMALDWEDTGGSQFFITHSPQPHLDARYTVFGRVVAGMDVVDRLVQWDVVRNVRIRDGVNPE